MVNYLPPVNQLLTFAPADTSRGQWPDYLKQGFGPEHIPDLIRMALDAALNTAMTESLEIWAPVHAWRILGQLHAEAASEPLLMLLSRIDDDQDDWVGEELPLVYEIIGAAAIPALTTYLADPSHGVWARVAAVSSLGKIAMRDVHARATCIPILTEQLSKSASQDPSLNGFLANALVDLQATESLPVIRQAYEEKHIDESIIGDWEDVEIEFGLREKRDTPRRPLFPFLEGFRVGKGAEDIDDVFDNDFPLRNIGNQVAHQGKVKAKARAKRKQQKQSRRKNRKR
jgi:hypothetical protein